MWPLVSHVVDKYMGPTISFKGQQILMDQSQIQKVTMKTMLPKDVKDSWKFDPQDSTRLATIIVPPTITIKGDKDLVANTSTKIEDLGNTTREGGPIAQSMHATRSPYLMSYL